MNRNALIAIIVVAIVVLGGGALLLTRSSYKTPSHTTSTTMKDNMQSQSSSSSSTPSATNSVTIADFAFSPASITVKKGTTVTWTNKDSATHTVTENDGQKGPDSGDLAQGKSYSFTFDTAGTFKYHCAIHSSMTGTVTVTE